MGPLQLIISGVGSLIVYGLVIAMVFKLFQIANELTEIKDAVQEIRRNTQDAAAPPAAWRSTIQSSASQNLSTENVSSPENLMRALTPPSVEPTEVDSGKSFT